MGAVNDFQSPLIVPDVEGTVFLFEIPVLFAVSVDQALVEYIVQKISGQGCPKAHRAIFSELDEDGKAVAPVGDFEAMEIGCLADAFTALFCTISSNELLG